MIPSILTSYLVTKVSKGGPHFRSKLSWAKSHSLVSRYPGSRGTKTVSLYNYIILYCNQCLIVCIYLKQNTTLYLIINNIFFDAYKLDPIYFFSSPELIVQISFFLIFFCPESVCLFAPSSIYILHFWLLLNQWANFNQTWWTALLGNGHHVCWNEMPRSPSGEIRKNCWEFKYFSNILLINKFAIKAVICVKASSSSYQNPLGLILNISIKT